MARKSIISKEQQETIKKLYKSGVGSTTIARKLNLNNSTVATFIKRKIGLRSQSCAARKYYCDEDFFENIDTEEKAYWLGFMYADGYVSSYNSQKCIGITLSNNDINHLIKFKNSINATYPIHTYFSNSSYSSNTKYSRILITSRKMFDDLVNQGVVEHKTLILKQPNIPESLYNHFIRGYIDGDGCITSHIQRNKKTPQFFIKIVGTNDVLNFIKDFIEQNNCAKIKKFYKRHKNDQVSNIDFGGNRQVKKFLDLLYKDATIYLDRKYEKYIELCNLSHCCPLSKGKG